MERQFKNRAQELRRSPRPQAWDRVEQRLDQRARKRRIGYYRLAGIAAGLLVLVGLTWTLTQTTYDAKSSPLAELDADEFARRAPLTTMSVAAEADYRQRARVNYASPIDEGDRDKQLVVVAPDGRKRLPTIAPAPERTGVERVSRLRVRSEQEWRRSL